MDFDVTGAGGTGAKTSYGEQEGTATVRQGETSLSDVAKRLGISEQSLKDANPKIDPNKINAGQELRLPDKDTKDTSKSSSTPILDHPTKVSEDGARRAAELALQGRFVEAMLSTKMNAASTNETSWGTDETKILRELAKTTGKVLSEEAKQNPTPAGPKIQQAMDRAGFNADALGEAFVKNLGDEDLKKLASTKEGREILDQMVKGMMDGNVEAGHQTQLDRINQALLSAPLSASDQANVLLRKANDGQSQNNDWLGKQLGDISKKDPANGAKVIDTVLRRALPADQDDIAAAITKSLTDEDLKKMTSSEEGKAVLNQMMNGMMDGNVEAGHQAQLDRINQALLSSPLNASDRANVLLRKANDGQSQNNEWLGKQLADNVKKNPAEGTAIVDHVLRRALESDRGAIAAEITKNFNHGQLKDLARTPAGKPMLDRVNKELQAGASTGPKSTQTSRIETAKIAVNLESTAEFGRLSETSKKDVLAAIGRNETSIPQAKNLADLAKAPGFDSLSDATRKQMLDAMEKKGTDPSFASAIKSLAGNPDFQKLGDAAAATVLKDLAKLTGTGSYKGMSETHRAQALDIIGTVAIHSAANPGLAVARNTLDKLLSGTVKMEMYEKKGVRDGGYADGDTMHFNTAVSVGRDQVIMSTIHEVNHILNVGTEAGTTERFLSEYRAYYVQRLGMGENPPSASFMDAVLEVIATKAGDGSSYSELGDLYKSDSGFKKVVDQMVADMNATPPKVMTPDELRVKLKGLRPQVPFPYSDPLDKPNNMDNH